MANNKDILDALNWRYATKKFNPEKKVSDEDLKILLESIRLAPTSFGLQPFKVFVITDRELREKLKPVSYNQSQVTDASCLIVFCARKNVDENYIKRYIEQVSKVRGVSVGDLKGFEDMLLGFVKNYSGNIEEWAKRQSYIALGFLLEAAALLGIDACPMEGFNTEEVDKILNLEEGLTSVAYCTLGYRDESDEYSKIKKARFDEKDLIEFR